MRKPMTIALILLLGASGAAFAADGKALFGSKCATCHGPDGTGDTPAGKAMKVPDLTKEGLSADAVLSFVKESKQHAGPTKDLSPDELQAIAEAVAGLGSGGE